MIPGTSRIVTDSINNGFKVPWNLIAPFVATGARFLKNKYFPSNNTTPMRRGYKSKSFDPSTRPYRGYKKRKTPIGKLSVRKPIVEQKWQEYDIGTIAAPTQVVSGSVAITANGYNCINALAQGVNPNQRVGNIVTIKSIHWRGQINIGTTVPTTVRLIILCRVQANSTAPNTGLYFSDPNNMTYSFNDLGQKKDFVILLDKRIELDNIANDRELFDIHLNNLSIPVYYTTANNGTYVDIDTNAIYTICSSDIAIAANVCPTISSKARIRYTDD